MRRFRFFIVISFLLFLGGCSSALTPNSESAGNPAAPPAPPAEVPAALVFPQSVSINVDKVRAGAPGPSLSALVGAGGEFSNEISFGPNVVFLENSILDGILGPLHELEIPVSRDVTNFHKIIRVGDRLVALKIDFSDYDFNGNGVEEGCSGDTAALPICYRIWADGRRVLAGMFEKTFPVPGNTGAGRFVGVPVDTDFDFTHVPAAVYDHRDPLKKTTEMFIVFPDEADTVFPHALVTQVGPEESALKTVNVNSGDDVFRAVGRWFEDEDFWIGSFEDPFDASPDFDQFENQCAVISTGAAAPPEACESLGLDISTVKPVRPTRFQDTLFPADFPERPTF